MYMLLLLIGAMMFRLRLVSLGWTGVLVMQGLNILVLTVSSSRAALILNSMLLLGRLSVSMVWPISLLVLLRGVTLSWTLDLVLNRVTRLLSSVNELHAISWTAIGLVSADDGPVEDRVLAVLEL